MENGFNYARQIESLAMLMSAAAEKGVLCDLGDVVASDLADIMVDLASRAGAGDADTAA